MGEAAQADLGTQDVSGLQVTIGSMHRVMQAAARHWNMNCRFPRTINLYTMSESRRICAFDRSFLLRSTVGEAAIIYFDER